MGRWQRRQDPNPDHAAAWRNWARIRAEIFVSEAAGLTDAELREKVKAAPPSLAATVINALDDADAGRPFRPSWREDVLQGEPGSRNDSDNPATAALNLTWKARDIAAELEGVTEQDRVARGEKKPYGEFQDQAYFDRIVSEHQGDPRAAKIAELCERANAIRAERKEHLRAILDGKAPWPFDLDHALASRFAND